MNGGCIETDYDVICKCGDGVTAIDRYDRTMLILSDSECATRFMPEKKDEVILLQWFGSDSEPEALVDRLTASPPDQSFPFNMVDNALRLLVGADDGNGGIYGFIEIEMPPGDKICEVYFSQEAQVIAIRPAETELSPDGEAEDIAPTQPNLHTIKSNPCVSTLMNAVVNTASAA
jgi:hypothetical protein